MARLLTDKELNTVQEKYILSAICQIAGYASLAFTVGWQAAGGVFLVHLGINLSNSADKIMAK